MVSLGRGNIKNNDHLAKICNCYDANMHDQERLSYHRIPRYTYYVAFHGACKLRSYRLCGRYFGG